MGAVGAAVMLMAQIPYEAARSNLASWIEAVGPDQLAALLPGNIDKIATIAGISGVAIALAIPAIMHLWAKAAAPIRRDLFDQEWTFLYNPKSGMSKLLSFNADGTIGLGRNQNEHAWRFSGNKLEILRETGELQNAFAFDAKNSIWTSVSHGRAVGIPGQTLKPKTA